MQKTTTRPDYQIYTKAGVGFPVKTGYAIFGDYYTLGTPISNAWEQPIVSDESEREMEFYWYGVEGATRLAAGAVSIVTALVAFF